MNLPDHTRWLDRRNFSPDWAPRSTLAASLLGREVTAVCDIGCGMQTLRHCLPPEIRYLPADLTRWSDDTELCDVNAGRFPETSILASDCCVALGLFEYISNPAPLFDFIAENGKSFITTYNTRENTPIRDSIWLSHFSGREFLSFARNAGFALVDVRISLGTELMFMFRPSREFSRSQS